MNCGLATKKPIPILYFRWENNVTELQGWLDTIGSSFEDNFEYTDTLRVKTLEGTSYNIKENDFIIRGVRNEFYPCDGDIFLQTYDLTPIYATRENN